jgi:phage head maturation protease
MPHKTAMLPILTRDAQFRAESIDEKKRTAKVTFTTGARVRRRRFFDEDINEELEVTPQAVRLDRLNAGAPFLNVHNGFDLAGILGVVVEGSARIENGRGVATVKFSERSDVAPIFADIKAGVIRNVSVGYHVHKYEIEKRDGEPELWRAVDWEPMEISAVPIGADPGAQVREDRLRQFQCALDYGEAAPAAKPAIIRRQSMPDGTAPNAPAEMTRAQLIDELNKRHNLGEDFVREFKSNLKATPADIRAAALEILAERDSMDIGHSQISDPIESGARALRTLDNPDFRSNAMASAIVHRIMPQTKNLAQGWESYRGWSFLDMAADGLERAGVRTRGLRPSQIINMALGNGRGLNARAGGVGFGAQGSGDFIGTVGDAARQFMLARYQLAPAALKTVAREMTFTDYREHQSIRGSAFSELQKVNEHGEITHGTLTDAGEKLSLLRYGRIVGLTHQALVNDAVGQFADLMSNAAETAIAQESTLLAAKVEENPDLADGEAVFSVAHANLDASGAAPDETDLSGGYNRMRQQKGLNNERIAPTPRYLIVPSPLEIPAKKLVAAITPAKTSDVNPFTELSVLVEPRFIDAAAWYIAADPAMTESLRYGYLDSENGPVVDERFGWEYDGIEIRVRLSFAAGWVDWRGWDKNPGA